jgi:hypothetical protein
MPVQEIGSMGYHVRVLISVGSIFILVFGYGCSSETNPIGHSPPPTPTATVSPIEMQLRVEDMRRDLADQHKWARLPNLEEFSLAKGQSETRICVGFDGAETPCFLLRSDGTQQTGELISAKFVRRGGNVTVLPIRKKLNAPKSGWAAFDQYLRGHGLTHPLRFAPDNKHVIDPDEGSIVIEMKTGADYSMISFPLGTETEDGKRALAICRKIETEFSVNIRCGSSTARLRRQFGESKGVLAVS